MNQLNQQIMPNGGLIGAQLGRAYDPFGGQALQRTPQMDYARKEALSYALSLGLKRPADVVAAARAFHSFLTGSDALPTLRSKTLTARKPVRKPAKRVKR